MGCFSNGYVYGGTPKEMRRVASVRVVDEKMLLVVFASGEERLFDATVLTGEAYEPLDEQGVFESACVDHGVVVWKDGSIDCSPDYMYENSVPYMREAVI